MFKSHFCCHSNDSACFSCLLSLPRQQARSPSQKTNLFPPFMFSLCYLPLPTIQPSSVSILSCKHICPCCFWELCSQQMKHLVRGIMRLDYSRAARSVFCWCWCYCIFLIRAVGSAAECHLVVLKCINPLLPCKHLVELGGSLRPEHHIVCKLILGIPYWITVQNSLFFRIPKNE